MSRQLMIVLVAAAMLAATGGCNNKKTAAGSSGAAKSASLVPELVPRPDPWIPDLPVPIGFECDQGKSRNYDLVGARLVDHLYKGRADKFAVKRFYERYMPANRWVMTTSMFSGGTVLLDFEKDAERCRITIGKGSLFHPTYITVKLWTSGPIKGPVVKKDDE